MRMHWNETPNKEGWSEHSSGQRESVWIKKNPGIWLGWWRARGSWYQGRLSCQWDDREPWNANVGLYWLRTGRAVRREKLGSAQNGSFRYQANWRKLGIHSTAELSVPDLSDITRKLAQCENKSAKRFLPLSNSPWRVDLGGAYGRCKRSTKQHF